MTAMMPLRCERSWAEHVLVRLLRRWAACRTAQEAPLPNLVALAAELGVPAPAAVAADSLFELTEACLGRPLAPECCCGRELSADEHALLLLVASAERAGPVRTTDAVPHGLPGALVWAAASLRLLLAETWPVATARSAPIDARRCPFDAHRRPQVQAGH